MRSLVFLACVAAGYSANSTWGDPLVGGSLPAQTQWVMHLDVDAVRKATPLQNLAQMIIHEPHKNDSPPRQELHDGIASMGLLEQLHDVSLFGNSFSEQSVCLRIHGAMQKPAIVDALRNDPEFQFTNYAGHDVVRFRDKDHSRLVHIGFAVSEPAISVSTWVILSPDQRSLEQALDAMDGKETLKDDSPLSPQSLGRIGPKTTSPLFWMAAKGLFDLPRMQKVECPLLAQLDTASLSVRWTITGAEAELHVQAKSEDSAQQIQAIAERVKADVAISAADEHAIPQLRVLSNALQHLIVQTDGKTAKGTWAVEASKLEMLANLLSAEVAIEATPSVLAVPAASVSTAKP
jgi:hypothetical protein